MIPFGGVIVGVALVGCVASVAWMAAEVVWAVREVRRRPRQPDYDYEVIPDAVSHRYWVPAPVPDVAAEEEP